MSTSTHTGRRTAGRSSLGFSLVELMTAIAIMAVLMAIAVPSFTSLINSNRLTSQGNEIVASLQYARSEAIRSNRRATLCPSTDGSSCSNADDWGRLITMVGDSVVRDTSIGGKAKVSANATKVDFSSDGLARDSNGMLSTIAITVCIDTERPAENQRVITLAAGSRTTVKSEHGTCE